jgi:hypothetical protein
MLKRPPHLRHGVGLALVVASASVTAHAQLAPMGGNDAARGSDTGFTGGVVVGGDYSASVPLEFPTARGGVFLPISMNYGGTEIGAVGVGWDVPLSYLRRDATLAHHRPFVLGPPGSDVDPQAQARLILVMAGQRIDLVPKATGVWVARSGAPQLEVRAGADDHTFTMTDGSGRTYGFNDQAFGPNNPDGTRTQPLLGTNVFILSGVDGPAGTAAYDYLVNQPPLPGGGLGIAINLIGERYNSHVGTNVHCYKNKIRLNYGLTSSTPFAIAMLGDVVWVRDRLVTSVDVYATDTCPESYVRLRS